MTTIVILTEESLGSADVAHITALHEAGPAYRVLGPAAAGRNLLVALVDHLSLGGLREALDEVLRRERRTRPEVTAAEQLAASLAAFAAAGAPATGEVTEDDPLPALRRAAAEPAVAEVVVVTTPHALEDTFHTDWASRAREELRVPVLHLYAGTSQLG